MSSRRTLRNRAGFLKSIWIFNLLICFSPSHGLCQSLIQNGSYESGMEPCLSPGVPQAALLDHWQAATNGSLRYIRTECPSPTADPYSSVYSGNGSLQIRGSTRANTQMSSSFAWTTLSQPLKAETGYLLAFLGRSQGISHVNDTLVKDCQINPTRDIHVYLGNSADTFQLNRTFGRHVLESTDLEGILSEVDLDQDPEITSFPKDWSQFTACFIATGEEAAIGFSGPHRGFRGFPPCSPLSDDFLDANPTANRFFHFFGFLIDEVELYEIPQRLYARDTICANQISLLSIPDLLPDSPPIFDNIQVEWEDGSRELRKSVTSSGSYQLEVIFSCIRVPMQLEVSEKSCPLPVVSPTAFSPNGDGINDTFKPVLNPVYNPSSYQFQVFDRWGRLVFSSQTASTPWRGVLNGSLAPEGVYAWTLTYEREGFAGEDLVSGTVVLMR